MSDVSSRGMSHVQFEALAKTSALGAQAVALIKRIYAEKNVTSGELDLAERKLRDQHREIERLHRIIAELRSGATVSDEALQGPPTRAEVIAARRQRRLEKKTDAHRHP